MRTSSGKMTFQKSLVSETSPATTWMSPALIQSRQHPKLLHHARFHKQQGRAGQQTSFTHCNLKICRGSREAGWEKPRGPLPVPGIQLGGWVQAVQTPVLQTYKRSLGQVSLLRSTGICVMVMKLGFLHEGPRDHVITQQRPRDWSKVHHQIFHHRLVQEMILENTISINFEFHYFKKKSALITKLFETSSAQKKIILRNLNYFFPIWSGSQKAKVL